MGSTHTVIVDLMPHACPEGSSERLARLLRSSLSTRAVEVQIITHFPPAVLSPPPDLILLRSPPLTDLPEMVQFFRKRWCTASILGLFCTEKDTPTDVSQALCDGLDDFLACPLRDIDVFPRIQRFLPEQGQTIDTPQAEEMQTTPHVEGLVGESDAFRQIIHKLPAVAQSEATVLISGETGTGKELIARAIHYHSPRQGNPFVPVNCGALPDHLVENELFGHAKGAYTDASSPGQGLVAEAEGGTLFLDEVDTLSASAQVTFLRFLQDYEYRPLGSSRSQTADVRIVAATNVDLWQQVQVKRFREDLYYRLHIIALHLSPLRERPDDIPLLATHFQ
jgi:two-component system response regulator GlrR